MQRHRGVLLLPQSDDRATEECGRQVMLNTIAFADSPVHAQALHAPLAPQMSAGLIRAIEVDQPSDFESIYRQGDAMLVSRRYRTDNILTDRGDDAVAILAAHLPSQPSSATLPLLIWRGASSWSDAAYSASGRWFFSTYAQWNEDADDEANRGWLKSLYDQLATVASGCYINEFDLEERSGSAHRCYSTENWSRLRQLRRRYDPHGVFHDVLMDVSVGDR